MKKRGSEHDVSLAMDGRGRMPVRARIARLMTGCQRATDEARLRTRREPGHGWPWQDACAR
jgi:hypothetical protein